MTNNMLSLYCCKYPSDDGLVGNKSKQCLVLDCMKQGTVMGNHKYHRQEVDE